MIFSRTLELTGAAARRSALGEGGEGFRRRRGDGVEPRELGSGDGKSENVDTGGL